MNPCLYWLIPKTRSRKLLSTTLHQNHRCAIGINDGDICQGNKSAVTTKSWMAQVLFASTLVVKVPGGSPVSPARASSSSGVPLLPGNVLSIDSWNIGQSNSTSASSSASAVRAPQADAELDHRRADTCIDVLGQPIGHVYQRYVFYANSTFSVSDNINASIGWAG